jgi:hypothetical protein
LTIPSSLTAAGKWLLGSGIHERIGGVARYYRSDLGRNAAVSTEITGYAASALVYLTHVTGERAYLDRAIGIGHFLTREAWNPELRIYPFECAADRSGVEPLAYFFDCGIVARGLLALWRETRESEFLDNAVACGRSMARDFRAGGAEYHPILKLPAKQPIERDSRWSRSPGCYQLKSAMAWFELFEETGQQEFADWYEGVLESALATHASFLPGDPDEDRVMDRLHAYCYFLEGLLPVLNRPSCARAAAGGVARAAALLRQIAPRFERSDVNAQILRFRIVADAAGVLPLDRLLAQEEADSLARFQGRSFDLRVNGGFYFGRRGSEMMPYVNPVSTAFGLQALAMWHAHRAGEPAISRQMLI